MPQRSGHLLHELHLNGDVRRALPVVVLVESEMAHQLLQRRGLIPELDLRRPTIFIMLNAGDRGPSGIIHLMMLFSVPSAS